MISFIKLHSEIFILLFLLFLTIDAFILIIKFTNNFDSRPNLKISYDISKSCYLGSFYDNEYILVIINLTIENKSAKSVDILNIKLLNRDRPYLAIMPKIKDINNKDKFESINLNIFSDNILLKNMSIPSQDAINGYAVFENVDLITDSGDYTISVETPRKIFTSQITLKPSDGIFQSGNSL
ncbi:hypothetical protein GKZ28_26800 [Clostridium chromiireducens]|uniref:Uncharacterized protein n=1 Tax=Clostridium chromiireducens TaxID=225345 RepID=A0A964W5A6_9CLOT|nr:hypothetical protein [Clostridium chromiireducens]MVX67254.1 hypothetical protein [Clostridium chromiireducens]